MAENLTERLEALAHGVLGPIVLGGPVRPVPPLGPTLALEIGAQRRIVDDDLRTRIDVARVRRARLLAPIDVLPELTPVEWAMVAALNDLLQATNHLLSGVFRRGRHAKLLAAVAALIEALPRPRTTFEVIVRHATFARVFELRRTDTLVSWWSGSRAFRGETPPPRLFTMRELRRVSSSSRAVPLAQLHDGLSEVSGASYQTLLRALVAKSPLTDLATLDRDAPSFAWSRETLELVSYPIGRALALRAVARLPAQAAVTALRTANASLPEGPARASADLFATEHLSKSTRAEGPAS